MKTKKDIHGTRQFRFPLLKKLYESLNVQFDVDNFVVRELKNIDKGLHILDAGCGSQRYKKYCSHLRYSGQDFAKFMDEDQITLLGEKNFGEKYAYGQLDYEGNIWDINEADASFDAILCTEVLEHIPYPIETVKELARLLKPGGKLIMTAPSNCLRHMDPYFYSSGYSDRWYVEILSKNGLSIQKIEIVGDYYRWMAVECARSILLPGFFNKIFLLPAFIYYFLKGPTKESQSTLCQGYCTVSIKA